MSSSEQPTTLRIGIDLGGTKIAGIALGADGTVRAERRSNTPQGDYAATIDAICQLIAALEAESGGQGSIGIGMPGSISERSGLAQNANSTWLNGKPFHRDVASAIGRPVRCANDANCFALSEAVDGAGQGFDSVFGVILGTGCGGGLVHAGRLIGGARGIGGEWGHDPLPWPRADEIPGPICWCGRQSCMETWVAGPAMTRDHRHVAGETLSAEAIVAAAAAGAPAALHTLDRHADRLARGLAMVVNIFDPHVIVLGGGLSQLSHLYTRLPVLMRPYVFSDAPDVLIRPPRHGATSGVRGAAWLWNDGDR